MKVVRVNELKEYECEIFHISWEDFILSNYKSKFGKKNVLDFTENFLKKQSKKSKILWTLHNITSHSFENKKLDVSIFLFSKEITSTLLIAI